MTMIFAGMDRSWFPGTLIVSRACGISIRTTLCIDFHAIKYVPEALDRIFINALLGNCEVFPARYWWPRMVQLREEG